MRLGIVGTQGAGKTTVFQLLTYGKLATPPTPNLMTADIPDSRVDFLSNVLKPKKTTYAKIEFLDPPGFTKTSLSLLQPVDALIYVVPFFDKFNTPTKSMQDLSSELILRDSEVCDNALKKTKESKDVGTIHELPLLLEKCNSALLDSMALRELELNEGDEKLLRGFGFLTLKPAVIILNTGFLADDVSAGLPGPYIQFNAKLEIEISELIGEERKEYATEFGIDEPPLNRFVRIGLPALKVISFFTVVGEEVRAWQLSEGTQVIKAAGKVHSDMERGFIRAEVIGFDDFKSASSFKVAKDKGLLRTVKQDYVVKDGDIIEFKFKV